MARLFFRFFFKYNCRIILNCDGSLCLSHVRIFVCQEKARNTFCKISILFEDIIDKFSSSSRSTVCLTIWIDKNIYLDSLIRRREEEMNYFLLADDTQPKPHLFQSIAEIQEINILRKRYLHVICTAQHIQHSQGYGEGGGAMVFMQGGTGIIMFM